MGHPLDELAETEHCRRVAHWLAVRGWSEGSGGNFSVRLDALPDTLAGIDPGKPAPVPVAVPPLGGQYLLVTGTGTRARDIAEDPPAGLGLFRIAEDGESIAFVCGNNRPTSEMPSHLAIHAALVEARPDHRALLHTHPPRLIAATHIAEFTDAATMGDLLLRMQSEAPLHLPDGLAVLPYHLPGSLELGLASAEAVRHREVVIWRYHGALATGRTLDTAFDTLEYLDKAAEIYWILRAAGIRPEGIPIEAAEKALRAFGRWERYARFIDGRSEPHAGELDPDSASPSEVR